jgi:hypothetical protein
MIEKINIENYEAYYLDYLENNLSDEDRILFELFLKNHPDLIEDDLIIEPLSETDNNKLSLHEKQSLKLFSNDEKVNDFNVEQFIIAYHEGILDQIKTKELLTFIQQYPIYSNLFNSYKEIKLKPDYTIQYSSKNALKKGKTRALYYFVAGVAAMLAFVIYFSQLNQQKSVVVSTNTTTKNNNSNMISAKKGFVNSTTTYVTKKQLIVEQIENNHTIDTIQSNENIEIIQQVNPNLIASTQPLLPSNPNENKSVTPTNKNENTYLSFSDMKKPIEVVTQFLPDEYQKFIDIRYAKPTDSKQGGFYIKIGDFQFSRKKSPDQNLTSR